MQDFAAGQVADPGWIERHTVEQRQAITNTFFRAQGVQAKPYTTQLGSQYAYADDFAESFWVGERKIKITDFKAENMATRQVRTRVSAGLLSRAFNMAGGPKGLVTKANGVLTAGFIGWEIGTGIRKLYLKLRMPEAMPQTYSESWQMLLYGGYSDVQPPIPLRDWVWGYALNNGYGREEYLIRDARYPTGHPCSPVPAPTGTRVSVGVRGRCVADARIERYSLKFEDLPLMDGMTEVRPADWPTYPTYTSDFPPTPTTATAQSALETELESPSGAFQRTVIDWAFDNYRPGLPLDFAADGAPMGRVQVPVGIGTPRDEYVQRLRELDLDVRTETAHDFNRDHDPGDVLYVNPGQQTWVERGSTIDIVVNTTTIVGPSPSATETASEYAGRASQYGLNPQLEYSTEPDPTKESDAIAGTPSPAPGTAAQPLQPLSVPAVNRPTDEETEAKCRVPGGSLPDLDAAFLARDTQHYRNVVNTFSGALAEPGGTLVLRVGQMYNLSSGSSSSSSSRARRDMTATGMSSSSAKQSTRPTYRTAHSEFGRHMASCANHGSP